MDRCEEIDEANLKEEFGDMYWYVGIMIDELSLDPENIFGEEYLERMNYDNTRQYLRNEIDVITIDIGEMIDLLKKTLMYGKELNVQAIAQKLTMICSGAECCLNMYAQTGRGARERNIEKLRARYGEKFTEAAALERNLTLEREILEKK
jgi:hypothetical protein